ncbi:hypothetical protein [Burkholderia sp. NLJ2]|uniref:hypothetical protein n=1 Tax=Burkholderia sp. NLJ2 TaxID=3090699 RepID=UPI003C6C3EFE
MARDLLCHLCIETTVRRERCEKLDRERPQALMVQDPYWQETEASEESPFQKSSTEHVSFLMILRDRIDKDQRRQSLFRVKGFILPQAAKWE